MLEFDDALQRYAVTPPMQPLAAVTPMSVPSETGRMFPACRDSEDIDEIYAEIEDDSQEDDSEEIYEDVDHERQNMPAYANQCLYYNDCL